MVDVQHMSVEEIGWVVIDIQTDLESINMEDESLSEDLIDEVVGA
jgi:hypothetical protein